MIRIQLQFCLLLGALVSHAAFVSADDSEVGFRIENSTVVISVAGEPVVSYVYKDRTIPRPFFAHLKAPGGIQVSRNHPPVAGQDAVDHDTMHPGIWLAFGDLNGEDFWRNKAKIVHEQFSDSPVASTSKCSFAVCNVYVGSDGNPICQEECRLTFAVRPSGYLLLWDSTFSSKDEFYFGDQEEMGLGIRVATPISVERGGTMVDSKGRRNGQQIWGKLAEWCDYSGVVNGQRVGMTIMCHPKNFRPSWMHARDYGFIAANPFGWNAFGKGEPSKVVVKPGEQLRLRYGVFLHARTLEEPLDLNAAFDDYVKQSREED